ncbi:MAG: DUF4251 domain-containing protein [Candidatus Symbiothrix sp.]|jgi:hypothetical protein|nr:DUF4251 domain-containing protein [Candidatus Symbiothrix sp.]
MKKGFFILMLLAVLAACSSLKQTKEEKEIRLVQVSESVKKDHYTIEVDRANPMRGKTITLTPTYDLTIRNDSAIAYLPYFGRVTYAPYGGGEGGIKFAQKMEEYQIGLNAKGDGWLVRFNIHTPEYNYTFNITIYQEGKAYISVTSSQRDPITFDGEMKWPIPGTDHS